MSLDAALQDIVDLFETTTPPADAKPAGMTSPGYKYLAHKSGFTGTSADDRRFEFVGFDREAQLEISTRSTRAAYVVPVQVYLSNDNLTRIQQLTRPAKELKALARAIERQADSWSPGVQLIATEGASMFAASGGESEDDFPESDVIIQLDLRIEVVEAD